MARTGVSVRLYIQDGSEIVKKPWTAQLWAGKSHDMSGIYSLRRSRDKLKEFLI